MRYITIIFAFLILTTISSAQILMNQLSSSSLLLELYNNREKIGKATGFIIKWNDGYYLITNWHVVTGKNPYTGETILSSGKIPTYLLVWHHYERFEKWKAVIEKLYDSNNKPRWLEHKDGSNVDVIALPLEQSDENIKYYELDLALADTDMLPEVSMPVSIIGFPNGMSGGAKLPIWKTGYIASEPELDYDYEPLFLIDATTKGGMSGSPVVLSLYGGYWTKDKTNQIISGRSTLFLGVYSGRMKKKSEVWPLEEIGIVWKARVIKEIFENN